MSACRIDLASAYSDLGLANPCEDRSGPQPPLSVYF